jgi:integrase
VLTELSIQKLRPAANEYEVSDGKVSGLRVAVQPTGHKSFIVRYRFAGRSRQLALGSYPALTLALARKRAQEANGAIAAGRDPGWEKKAAREALRAAQVDEHRVEKVFEEFKAKYLARHVGAAWAREAERLMKAHVLPKLGARRFGDVKRSDVRAVLGDIVDGGAPISANRTLAVLSRFCNWAVEQEIIAVSPCAGVKMPSAENERDRVLEGDELRLAWRAFESIGFPHGPIAQLLLLTGARRSEVGGMKWDELNVVARTWTLPKERSKNGISHEIPLSDAAISVIEKLPRFGGTFVFGAAGRTAPSGFSKAKSKVDAMILAEGTAAGLEAGPKPWVLHDLRRSAASGMASLGIAPHVVEAVLNHKSGTIKGVAKVYNRYSYMPEKRAALDAWARRLHEIVTGEKAANVVELATARA